MKLSFLTIGCITCIWKFKYAWVAELVDARDLKSLDACRCTSSILVLGTKKIKGLANKWLAPFFWLKINCKHYVSTRNKKRRMISHPPLLSILTHVSSPDRCSCVI